MKSVKGTVHMAAGKHILAKRNTQRVFGTAKVGDRGQIVIPKEAREFFGIEPGDTLLGEGDCRFADSLAALLASPFEGAMILEGKYATFEDIGREIAALKKLMGE